MENMENEMTPVYDMLTIISRAPDSQIDKTITTRLKSLFGKTKFEIKMEVMHCIDDCVRGSLASPIGLSSLHMLHEAYLDGDVSDFNVENCYWRK